jgi:hypothetical protein
MSTSRQRLSKSEIAAHLARAEKMLAAGVNIQIREEWREHGRAQDALNIAVGGGCATFVFDLTAGRAGYVISVRLVGRASGTVLDCRLTTSWDDDIALASYSDEGNSMCRLGLLQYSRGQVLNQRIENSMRFVHGQVIEGVILATGANPIPETYRHGLIVPISLAFSDQNENEIRENGELFVDRLYKPKRKSMPRRSGLYDRGTTVPTSAEVINQNPQTEFRDPEFRGGTDCSVSKRS